MNKPVGGRGKVAKYPTIMRRIPEGIKEAVERLSDLYRSSVWDGRVDNLNSNLISGNDPQGNLVIVVHQLLSKIEQEGALQSLPYGLREEFLERVRVALRNGERIPDIENEEKARTSRQFLVGQEEVEHLTTQLNSCIPSTPSTPKVEEPSKEKPDIKYKEAECHRQLKEAKASIKKLERQIKAQAEHIHQLSQRVNKRRNERDEYKQKWAEVERQISQLTSNLAHVEGMAADSLAVQEKNEQLQQELEELRQKEAFLTAEAEDKQKMVAILHEAINPELQLVGKIKSLIQLALVTGRGEYRENIDESLHYLKRAIRVADISLGYDLEKKALSLVGEKPRRVKKR
jgi:chromosome segregation ATPase